MNRINLKRDRAVKEFALFAILTKACHHNPSPEFIRKIREMQRNCENWITICDSIRKGYRRVKE